MNRKETAKTFMYACFGILALAGAVQIVAPNAVAQSIEPTTVAAAYSVVEGQFGTYYQIAIMSNGDVYKAPLNNQNWAFQTNIFAGNNPIQNSDSSLGDVKQRFSR